MKIVPEQFLVVVGFAEALSGPEVVWSLVDAGCKVIAFSRKDKCTALRHSRHVKIYEISSPETDCAAALKGLNELLESYRKHEGHRVLLPLDDSSIWLCSQIKPTSGWVLAGPRDDSLDLALNKQVQMQSAKAAGFNVPETTIMTRPEEFAAYEATFPLILRAANAALFQNNILFKGRNWICANQNELDSSVSAWNADGTLLVQPYLEGVGEGIFGLATKDGVMAWSAHRRLRMMNPHGSGSSACISQTVPDDIKAIVEAFIKSSGWRGMFMVELLRTQDGKLWFVEFNGRAWGSMALSRRQSLEYPAWAVQLAVDPQTVPDYHASPKAGLVCRNLGRELMHLLFVLRGPKSKALQSWPSLGETFRGLFLEYCKSPFYNWRKDDWRVFVFDFLCTVRNQIFKGI